MNIKSKIILQLISLFKTLNGFIDNHLNYASASGIAFENSKKGKLDFIIITIRLIIVYATLFILLILLGAILSIVFVVSFTTETIFSITLGIIGFFLQKVLGINLKLNEEVFYSEEFKDLRNE